MKHAVIIPSANSLEVLYLPLPIQVSFIEAVLSGTYRRILFGGAAGASKSHALRWLGHALCLSRPGFKVLLLRRKFPQLEESHLSRVDAECKRFGANYLSTDRVVKYGNGSRFKFGHCAEKGDETNFLSDEYDLILFDEMTTFEESQIVLISSRARTSKRGWKPVVAGGTNPGGVSAAYCLSHFVTQQPDPLKYPRYKREDYFYIPATLDDNPYLNMDYEQSLDDLPSELREAYRNGNWNIFPGQFFKEWRPSIHTVELDIPKDVDRFLSLDWGYLRPGCVLWWVALPDGKLYVEREWMFQETIAAEVAKTVQQYNRRNGLKIRYCAADPAINIRSGESGESIAETLRRNGLPTRNAKNERVNGWARIRHLLRLDKDGIPFLRVSGINCPYLTRTLPQLVSDDHKPEDINSDSEDHAADALRYGAMSRPAPTRFAGPTLAQMKGTVGEDLYKVIYGIR